MADGVRLNDGQQQLDAVTASLHDTRPTLPTGVGGIDSLLRRGGLLPGSFTLFGGRTGTRKTTTVLNMLLNMARADIPVVFVGLDEPLWMYVIKFMSAYYRRSQDSLEEAWDTDEGKTLKRQWRDFAKGRLHIASGRRPTPSHLSGLVEMAQLDSAPRLVVVDFLALMTRAREYGWQENDRLPRIAEDLALWSTETGTAVLVLHQLSRNDEYGGTNNRNAGHLPVTLTQLKYGGEEPADMVFSTFRPSMNPLATMSMPVAKMTLGDRFDEDEYWEIRSIAEKYKDSTFLQLLKNRPGTHREERGVEMYSPDDSLFMEEREAPEPAREESSERQAAHRA